MAAWADEKLNLALDTLRMDLMREVLPYMAGDVVHASGPKAGDLPPHDRPRGTAFYMEGPRNDDNMTSVAAYRG